MATWQQMTTSEPKLARLGTALLIETGRGFLATTRRGGAPRVQAVCPVVHEDQLLVGLVRATPKYGDLIRDPRFALHAPLGKGDTEFWMNGSAFELSSGEAEQVLRAHPGWDTHGRSSLFRLDVESPFGTLFRRGEDGLAVPDRRSYRDETMMAT